MEKIYIENNNKNKSFFGRIIHSSFSVKCSFMLAIITMFSVVFSPFVGGGATNSSYALPDVESSLPDSFVSKLGTNEIRGNSSGFYVNDYYTAQGLQVFCLENNIAFSPGTSYKKGSEITDYGLLYLMANSYPNKQFTNTQGEALDARLQTWITQVSIWIYQKQVGAANSDQLTDDKIEKIKLDTAVTVGDSLVEYGAGLANGETLYSVYIKPLIDAALTNKNVPNKVLEVSIENDKITLDADEKYYKSSLITVNGAPSDNFNGYMIELNNYPEGTLVVDENGNTIELKKTFMGVSSTGDTAYAMIADNIKPSTKFYLKVPVSEVTEEKKTIKISVTGSFTVYDGNYYIADGAQTITNVKTVNTNVDKGIDISFNYTPDVPDTKMDVSQTVYFIGLLILLAGIGIIYANVLPKKEQY